MLSKSTSSFSVVFALVAVLLYASASSAGFTYTDFSSTAGLNLVSAATTSGTELRLTPATPNNIGAAWYATKQRVYNGFITTFDFRVTSPSGATDTNGQPGGDGFAFVVQNSSGTAIGAANFYMAYEIANSLAAEFDTFRNNFGGSIDPNGNHVGVQSNGTSTNSHTAPAFKGSAIVGPNMSNGGLHTAKIVYLPSPGTLKMFVDNMSTPVLTVPINLSTLLSLDAGKAYVGFTAGGAGAYENHLIANWTFTSLPEPGTFLTVGLSIVVFGALYRRWPLSLSGSNVSR